LLHGAVNCLAACALLFHQKQKHMKNIITILFWVALFTAFNMQSSMADNTTQTGKTTVQQSSIEQMQ
jgi:hypothetical protein